MPKKRAAHIRYRRSRVYSPVIATVPIKELRSGTVTPPEKGDYDG
jgi:hypothetical protein